MMFGAKSIGLLLFCFILTGNLWAQDEALPLPVAEESMIDLTHKRLSSSLFYLSDRIDSFFGGERADDLPNPSRVRIFWTINKEESTALKGEAAIRLNIALVETEKKLKISFKNKYEKQHEQVANQPPTTEPTTPVATNEPVPYDIKDLLRWRARIDSGVRIDFPPDPFVRLTTLKSWHFGLFELSPSQQFYWYLKNGFGETTRLDLNRAISEELLFRYENEVSWTDESDQFVFSSGPTLYQQLTDNRGLSVGAKVLGESRPTWYVNDYRLEVIYRQVILRKWFFVEMNPYIHFPKEKDWDRTLGFNLRFELVIGNY